tara:strand:+ start:19956 stop:20099 length:144 start_codon:yes stop_codon:yes gene_type:complete
MVQLARAAAPTFSGTGLDPALSGNGRHGGRSDSLTPRNLLIDAVRVS